MAGVQTGRVQLYLRLLALAVVLLAAISDLEQPRMNGVPLLTLLTLLPLVGAAIALVAKTRARLVAILTSLVALALALLSGRSFRLMDRSAWWSAPPRVPSLGIEYHLGVDALGALMLVLSAIVTLMSIDAAHSCAHRQPGLFFALVLMLESGSIRYIHCAQFLSLVSVLGVKFDPRLLPDQALGRSKAGPGSNAVLLFLHDGRFSRTPAVVPCDFSLHGEDGLRTALQRWRQAERWSRQ